VIAPFREMHLRFVNNSPHGRKQACCLLQSCRPPVADRQKLLQSYFLRLKVNEHQVLLTTFQQES
jgi:hypothetical protein